MYTAEKYGLDMAKRIDNGMEIDKASLIAIWEMAEDMEEDHDNHRNDSCSEISDNDRVNFATLVLKANWKMLVEAFKEARGIDLDAGFVEKYFPSDEFKCTSEGNLYDAWQRKINSIYESVEADIKAELERTTGIEIESLINFGRFLQKYGML